MRLRIKNVRGGKNVIAVEFDRIFQHTRRFFLHSALGQKVWRIHF